MTAADLYELVKDLPAEALCGTIRYYGRYGCGEWVPEHSYEAVNLDHAEALHRDAMTEWLAKWDGTEAGWAPAVVWLASENIWWAYEDHDSCGCETIGTYPTRTHALAAAVRYVAGQADSSPSSS